MAASRFAMALLQIETSISSSAMDFKIFFRSFSLDWMNRRSRSVSTAVGGPLDRWLQALISYIQETVGREENGGISLTVALPLLEMERCGPSSAEPDNAMPQLHCLNHY